MVVTIKPKTLVFIFCCSLVVFPYPGFMGGTILRIFDFFPLLFSILILLVFGFTGIQNRTYFYFSFLLFFFLFFWMLTVFFVNSYSSSFPIIFRDFYDFFKPVAFLMAMLVGFVSAIKVNKEDMQKIFDIIIMLVIGVAILQALFGVGFWYYLFSARSIENINEHYQVRVIGTMGNPNFLGLIIASSGAWFLYRWFGCGEKKAIFYLCISLVILFFAQSRTGFILFLILACIALFFSYYLARKSCGRRVVLFRFVRYSPLFLILILALVFTVKSGYFSYLSSGYDTVLEQGLDKQSSFSGRLIFWSYFLQLIYDNPVFGYGPSKGWTLYDVADNNYIFLAFKYGTVGLIIYMTIIFIVIRCLWNVCVENSDARIISIYVIFLWFSSLFYGFLAETLESVKLVSFIFFMSGWVFGVRRVKVYSNDFR